MAPSPSPPVESQPLLQHQWPEDLEGRRRGGGEREEGGRQDRGEGGEDSDGGDRERRLALQHSRGEGENREEGEGGITVMEWREEKEGRDGGAYLRLRKVPFQG